MGRDASFVPIPKQLNACSLMTAAKATRPGIRFSHS